MSKLRFLALFLLAGACFAQSVINEYTWPDANSSDQTTFTIALKDGSRRFAETVWVEDRNLHFIDSDDNHAVLSSDLIDRDATRRLNREKNLRIQLPPA